MGKRIGIWDNDTLEFYEYTLVRDEDMEYFSLFYEESNIDGIRFLKLKKTVKRNPEIFALYLAESKFQDIEVDSSCYNSASGYCLSLMKEFIDSFNKLEINKCISLYETLSKIDFSSYYIYRIKNTLDFLIVYASFIRDTLLDILPFDLRSKQDFDLWWDGNLILSKKFIDFDSARNFDYISELDSLSFLKDKYEQFKKAVKSWSSKRGIENFEVTSGYFQALSAYYFRVENYQASILLSHRSIELLLEFTAYRNSLLRPTTTGLLLETPTGESDNVNLWSTFKVLWSNPETRILFRDTDKDGVSKLNRCRNQLRETHGFRVVTRQEADNFLALVERLIKTVGSDLETRSYAQRFSLDLNLNIQNLFSVESELDSYFSEIDA